jgi:hypothetical protein
LIIAGTNKNQKTWDGAKARAKAEGYSIGKIIMAALWNYWKGVWEPDPEVVKKSSTSGKG